MPDTANRLPSSMLLGALCGLVAVACGSEQPKPAATAPQAAQSEAGNDDAAKQPEAKARGGNVKVVEGSADDPRYALKIETPGDATAGQENKVTIRVLPAEGWHMNLDFPTSLKMNESDGVKLSKAQQEKADAIKLDDANCQYDVSFIAAAAGDKSFTGKFKFAICEDEGCVPVTKDLEFKVAVK